MIRRQRLADTALALLLRVKLTDPAPDGTFAKRHSPCGLRQKFFKIFVVQFCSCLGLKKTIVVAA